MMKSHNDDHDPIIDPIVGAYRLIIVKPTNAIGK
jgi:hypothetical protein